MVRSVRGPWLALNFAKAGASPDGLSGVWVQNGQLFLLGSVTVEPWGVTDDDNYLLRLSVGPCLSGAWRPCNLSLVLLGHLLSWDARWRDRFRS